jgi:hypothetical protein
MRQKGKRTVGARGVCGSADTVFQEESSGHLTKDAPSSDVKHWALLNEFSAWTVTDPLG